MVQINKNGYDLGALEDGAQVGDVVLPPWAKGDPYKFIRIHREALESDYVSAHLHKWIGMVRSKGCHRGAADHFSFVAISALDIQ
jgi:hypothetical protein